MTKTNEATLEEKSHKGAVHALVQSVYDVLPACSRYETSGSGKDVTDVRDPFFHFFLHGVGLALGARVKRRFSARDEVKVPMYDTLI